MISGFFVLIEDNLIGEFDGVKYITRSFNKNGFVKSFDEVCKDVFKLKDYTNMKVVEVTSQNNFIIKRIYEPKHFIRSKKLELL